MFVKKPLLVLTLVLPMITSAQVLFEDAFDGTNLDTTKWFIKDTPLGRTQMGLSPVISDGNAKLWFETYNPINPELFNGTEIQTITKYSLDTPGIQGLEFETRMRAGTSLPNGLVAGFFTFGRDGYTFSEGGIGRFDEIDIEIVSNLIPKTSNQTQQILVNAFDGQTNGIQKELGPKLINVIAVDLFEFNTYTIHWFANKIEWFINDQKLFTLTEEAAGLADSEQGLHLNLWAPNSNFALAFDSELIPTTDPDLNESYFVEVDYVRITAIPEQKTYAVYFASITALVMFLTRKQLFGKKN